jgi:hypothetical protein
MLFVIKLRFILRVSSFIKSIIKDCNAKWVIFLKNQYFLNNL